MADMDQMKAFINDLMVQNQLESANLIALGDKNAEWSTRQRKKNAEWREKLNEPNASRRRKK